MLTQHTCTQLLVSPGSEIEPSPLKNCNNARRTALLPDKKASKINGTKQHPYLAVLRLLIPSKGSRAMNSYRRVHPCSPTESQYPACAQQAAQLGSRCGSRAIWSWETKDTRVMAGLLLGLGSALQQFNEMLRLMRCEL